MMKNKIGISFSGRLFLSVTTLFLAFVICFVAFQFHRERIYKASLLNERLQSYNREVAEKVLRNPEHPPFSEYVSDYSIPHLRLTVIDSLGKVLYDSAADPNSMPNHLGRKEVTEAMTSESLSGYDIMRSSMTLGGQRLFYSASYFPDDGVVIRSALPYDVSLTRMLSADHTYLWLAGILSVLLLFIYFRFTRRLGKYIRQLRTFAEYSGAKPEHALVFPKDELGDVSRELVELYGRLKESEDDKTRLKRQLTENIAHELKTPVSSIQGYLETIVNEPELDSETKNRFIKRVYAQSQRLASLLEDISILNKLDDAPHTYESTEVNIAALLQLIQADTAPQLSSKNITYRALVDNDVIVRGNRSLLYSAFRNLTDNSIAYAGEGVTITIRMTEETEDAYAFSFSDNGVGVPSEHLPRLFERFYRVDKGRSRKLGGTGLGLAIVKNAVFLHHGTISASIAQTGGLEFDFTIAKNL